MAVVLHAMEGIFTVLIMIGLGFIMEKKGMFLGPVTSFISKLVSQVGLPAMMFSSINKGFTRESLLDMSGGLPVCILSMTGGYILGHIVARLLKIKKERRGIFCSVFFVSNVIFIGLPITLSLFGDESLPALMSYYMVNTCFFWIVAAHDIAMDGGVDAPLLSKQSLKAVVSPPLMGFIVGVIMVLLGIRVPTPILKATTYIGNLTIPLAMFFIGIALARTQWSDIRFNKDVIGALCGRYIVSPLLVLVLLRFFPVPQLTSEVFVMASAMPAMTNTSIVASYYGADYKYSALLTVVSTVFAVLTVPFYMWVLRG